MVAGVCRSLQNAGRSHPEAENSLLSGFGGGWLLHLLSLVLCVLQYPAHQHSGEWWLYSDLIKPRKHSRHWGLAFLYPEA